MEPFVREDMSPEAKEANLFWIGDLWQQYLESVSRHRGIPLEDLTRAINRFPDGVEESGGDLAQHALDLGLVDRLVDRPQANYELAQLGAAGTGGAGFRQIEAADYLHFTDLQVGGERSEKVAIVVAEGDIVRGHQPQGMVGAMTLGERLRDVAEDSSVKAVVLRINSPGGDVFAAENIRREVQALKEGGKTVVVSMGDVAASGGYWIAMALPNEYESFAHPFDELGAGDARGIFEGAGAADDHHRVYRRLRAAADFWRAPEEARNRNRRRRHSAAGRQAAAGPAAGP